MQPRYRHQLPQLNDQPLLTDGAMESALLFRDGFDLPDLAAFVLLSTAEGTEALRRYARMRARRAVAHGVGVIIDTATRRASAAWGARLGYDADRLFAVNVAAVELIDGVRELETAGSPIVISGAVGPRRDGIDGVDMTVRESEAYHRDQIRALEIAGADLVTGLALATATEAAGLVLAAREADIPVAVSFTVETDGRLPEGQALDDAIAFVDLVSDEYPAYFMADGAHPIHRHRRIAQTRRLASGVHTIHHHQHQHQHLKGTTP